MQSSIADSLLPSAPRPVRTSLGHSTLCKCATVSIFIYHRQYTIIRWYRYQQQQQRRQHHIKQPMQSDPLKHDDNAPNLLAVTPSPRSVRDHRSFSTVRFNWSSQRSQSTNIFQPRRPRLLVSYTVAITTDVRTDRSARKNTISRPLGTNLTHTHPPDKVVWHGVQRSSESPTSRPVP